MKKENRGSNTANTITQTHQEVTEKIAVAKNKQTSLHD